MKYDNSLFYIEKINPRPTIKKGLPLRVYLSPFLFYEEQGQRRKEKSDGGDEPALSPRTNRSRAPTTTTERQYERARALLPCCGARKTLTLDGARLRFSTAATRPSPLHPPPAARRRAPPPPPLVSRVSCPETQLTCIRARLEY